uniref:Protein nervous wreck-like n=1 Tax=Diabrotica virgifera virgifera TaxID=50390 RepID=A0A6P7FQN2_DIAVI
AQNPDELTIVENEQLEVVGEGDGDGWLRARNYRGEEGYVPQNYLDIVLRSAQNPDELTIVENEQLEVVGEGDGDGWLRARNYRGEEGYVPQNYLDIEREQSVTTPGLQTQISFSSVDYTVDNEEESAQQATETTQSPEQISVISIPQKTPDGTTPEYCIALYDYEGEGGEELTFEEGQIIKILSRCAHSIDDGWWQGELEGHIGNFPSLVVEECDEFGEPLVNEWDETPPQSAPPVFTPPDVPDYLADTEEGKVSSLDKTISSVLNLNLNRLNFLPFY